MKFKIAGLIVVIVLILGAGFFFFLLRRPESQGPVISPISPQTATTKKQPSSTLKEYSDPSGFSFNYPDDLSLVKNEATDDLTYADLKLKSKEGAGSLNLKIQETKLTSIKEWFEENGSTSSATKKTEWGTLNAQMVEDKDRILLVAIDQGVLFTIEVLDAGEKDFWQASLNSILSSFTFSSGSSPDATVQTSGTSMDDVIFEGEEIVE